MKISKVGLDLICKFEGFSDHPYLDIAKIPTIGYGHKILPSEKFTKITQEEAESLLTKDVIYAEKAVNDLVKIKLTQDQFDAIVSFVYNVGAQAFKESTFLKLLNQNKIKEAVKEMLKWDHVNHEESASLLNRRETESLLLYRI